MAKLDDRTHNITPVSYQIINKKGNAQVIDTCMIIPLLLSLTLISKTGSTVLPLLLIEDRSSKR